MRLTQKESHVFHGMSPQVSSSFNICSQELQEDRHLSGSLHSSKEKQEDLEATSLLNKRLTKLQAFL